MCIVGWEVGGQFRCYEEGRDIGMVEIENVKNVKCRRKQEPS